MTEQEGEKIFTQSLRLCELLTNGRDADEWPDKIIPGCWEHISPANILVLKLLVQEFEKHEGIVTKPS